MTLLPWLRNKGRGNRKSKKTVEELILEIEEEGSYAEVLVETPIQTGRAINAILETDQSIEIDLVVMGTKGRTGLKKILFGSTTAETK